MAEQATRFEGHGLLDPEDHLFARVVLRNKLATKEDIEGCIHEILAERKVLGPSRKLADILVESGHLKEEEAVKVRRAIEKKIAERLGRRAPPGDSLTIKADAVSKSEDERERLRAEVRTRREKRMRRLVKLTVRSRHHQEVLLYVIPRRIDILNPVIIAGSLGLSRKDVLRVIHEWKQRGTVTERGAYPYAFEPIEEERKSMEEFCRLWRDPAWHPKLLGMILEEEG